MRAVFFSLLILSVSASHALAYGAIAAGENGRTLNFTSAHDEDTYDAANLLSLERCRDQGLAKCAIRWNFQNLCISIGLAGDSAAQEGDAATAYDAREQMLANCKKAGAGACTEVVLACDQTASTAPIKDDPTAGIPLVTTPPTILDQILNLLRLPGAIGILAGLIVVSLLAWIFISIVSTTPVPILQRRVLITAWITVPAAPQFAVWMTGTKESVFFTLAAYALSLWTDTFAALILGGQLRRRLSPKWKPPDPLSLPVANLAFTIAAAGLIWLFDQYVILPHVIGCIFAAPADACHGPDWENIGTTLICSSLRSSSAA